MIESANHGLMNLSLSQYDESVFLLDKDGVIREYCNNNTDLLRMPDDQLIGEMWCELVNEEAAFRLKTALEKLENGHLSSVFRYSAYKNGSVSRYHVRCSKLTGSGDFGKGYLLILKEEPDGRVSEGKYDNQFEMHKLITEIATDFVNIPLENQDQATYNALAEIGRFTGAHRVYVCTYNFNKEYFTNTYEWCAEGISREIDNLQHVPFDQIREFVDAHVKGDIHYIPDTVDMPAGNSTKSHLQFQGIRSVITIPMIYQGECLGFVGLDSVGSNRSWQKNEIRVLMLFSDLLANTEIRRRNELKLRQSENRHSALLDALPDIIFSVTKDGEFLEIYSSDPAELLLSVKDVIGRSISEILPEELAGKCIQHINLVHKTGNISIFEYNLTIGGEIHHYEARVVKSDHQEILLVVRDITESVDSQERIQQITNNIPGAIYTFKLRPDGLMELPYISDGIEELTGLPADTVCKNMNLLWTRIHPDELQGLMQSIQESARHLTNLNYEYRIKNAEDNWIWVQTDSTPLKSDDGTIVWYGHIRDVTETKTTEATLAHEREMMNTLMETIPDQIYFKNRESKFIRLNHATASRFDFEHPEDMIGKSDHDFFSEEHYLKAFQDEQEIIRTGEPIIGVEEKEVWPDGRITWASTTKMPLYDHDREIIGTFGISRDITYRKKAEQILRQREAYLSAIIENQNGLIWLKDLEGRFVLVNKKFALACGFESPEQMTGKTDFEICKSTLANKYTEEDRMVISTGKMIITQEKKLKGSKETWFETYKSPVKDENGIILGITGYSLEITDRKKKIEQVRRLNDQLNALNNQKDKLFSILAHDLRNPFAGSIGMLEMIIQDRTSITDDELNEYIKLLYENTLSSYKLLENILEWSHTQRNKMTHSPGHFDLKEIIEQTFAVVRNSAIEKKISLHHDIPDGSVVYADRDMLHAILRNLITNGIKFTNQGGRITICSSWSGENPEIAVTDTGIGIHSDQIDNIFNLNHESSTRGTCGERGTGLGLQICKEFVELHGGTICVESKSGKGSTFRFTLPEK